MTSLAEAFGLGRGCFGREGVLRCTGTFPETGLAPLLTALWIEAPPPLRTAAFLSQSRFGDGKLPS